MSKRGVVAILAHVEAGLRAQAGAGIGVRGANCTDKKYEVSEIVGQRHEVVVDRAQFLQILKSAGTIAGGSEFGGCVGPLVGCGLP